MFLFLLIVQTLVAIGMISVILMQRSEGGGLTSGGSPSGLMTARGAADFLTRATTVLAAIFIGLSILLAALAASAAGPRTIDANAVAPAQPAPGAPAPVAPGLPAPSGPAQVAPGLPPPSGQAGQPAPAQGAQPAAPAAPANQAGGVPIAQ